MIEAYKNNKLAYFIATPLVLFGIYSFMSFHREEDSISIIPTTIYEILVFSYCLLLFFLYKKGRIRTKAFSIFIINLVYIILSYLYAVVYHGAHVLDFLLIFKTFVYLLFLALIVNEKVFNKIFVLKFINIIFLIFFLKYLISQIFNINSRPIVYVENNFELMFLCILYLIRFQLTKKNQILYLFFLGCIVLLSLSRSAVLIYALVALFVVYRANIKYKTIIFLCVGGGVAVFIMYIFLSRSDSIEDIDRFKFMLVFFRETESWNFLDYLVGSPRITPLSEAGCNFFRKWENLFSNSGNGECYSVVMHSYLLRVVFDHGIIGLISVIYFVYQILRLSGIDKIVILAVIGIFMINGLSVSSFNSVFFPISIIFLIGTKYNYAEKVINIDNKSTIGVNYE